MKQLLPAYPLFVKDPYFSIWSDDELLNKNDPMMWWGERKPMLGIARVNGKAYGFFGNVSAYADLGLIEAEQTDLSVDAFSTRYTFDLSGVKLSVRFVSPLPLSDLSLLSMPTCYMEYEIKGAETAEVSLIVGKEICHNASHPSPSVYAGVTALSCGDAAFVGLSRQLLLSNADDLIGADWGYWYLCSDRAATLDFAALRAFVKGEPIGALNVDHITHIAATAVGEKGSITLGFDNGLAVQYFDEFLKGYYLEDHTIIDALEYTVQNRSEIEKILSDFEADMVEKAAPYGADYLLILNASLRQSIAGHTLVRDKDGNFIFLSKENNSNGCIGTVDVSYPSMPLYLLYQPELVRGMMRPILRFSRSPVWKYDFAPHDVGTFPLAIGQVYGLVRENDLARRGSSYRIWKEGEAQTRPPFYLFSENMDMYLFDMQMPVEECANMLIMCAAACKMDGNYQIFMDYQDLFDCWVQYLVKYGRRPDTQLCTDDFAGHLKDNINLAVKAAVGIAAYASMLDYIGSKKAKEFFAVAKSYANEIMAFGEKFSHIPLTFDADDTTFSLKYNMAFDKILGFGLFTDACREREVDTYIEKANRYGTPLDNRANYTKSDWIVWSAALTDSVEKKKTLIAPLARYLRESTSRVPFSDWYFTTEGTWRSFRARTVQGGCFILMM